MKNRMTNEEWLLDNGYEDVLVFESPSFEGALIGVDSENRAVYNMDLMIEAMLDENEDWGVSDAIEFIEYNTLRALPYYPNSPIVISNLRC